MGIVVGAALAAVYQQVKTPVEIGNDELWALTEALVRTMILVGGTEATINSILMSSPHIGQSALNILIVCPSDEVGWQE